MTLLSPLSGAYRFVYRMVAAHKWKLAAALLAYRMLARKKRASVRGAVVVITGGASGLGKLIAGRLAARGALVVLWDVDTDALRRSAVEIAREGGQVWTYKCNVGDAAAVRKLALRVKAEVGHVDILINNAGIVAGSFITDIPSKRVERTFRVNIISHFFTIKAFLPDMLAAGRGHIVTVASMGGTVGAAKLTDFCASKYAAVGMAEALRQELRVRGMEGRIHSTCCCPYVMTSGSFDRVAARPAQASGWSALLPRLPRLDAAYVADRIVDAILTRESLVLIPSLGHLISFARVLLPTPLFDKMLDTLGNNAVLRKRAAARPPQKLDDFPQLVAALGGGGGGDEAAPPAVSSSSSGSGGGGGERDGDHGAADADAGLP